MDDRELTKEPDDREDSKKRVVNAVNVISNVFYYLYHGSVVGALVYLFIYSQHCDQLNTRVANLEGVLLTFKFKNDQLMAFYQDVVLVLEKTVRSADLKLSDTKSSLRGKREIIGRDRLADISSLLRGRDGDDGAPGPPGPPGHAGVQGPPGTHGPAGIQGPAGTHGPSGIQGQPGQPGLPGRPGPQGKEGHDGLPGRDAYNLGAVTHYLNATISRLATEVRVKMLNEKPCQCLKGDPGTDGRNGTNGKPGATGPSGLRGAPGSKGEQGIRGDRGNIGPPGTPGVQGQKGEQGLSGRPGSQGDMGSKGDIGKIGNPGQKGEAGLTCSPGARGAQDCTSVVNGAVRLNGTRDLMVGETTLSGAVETFYNGRWGYVCDNGYNTAGNYLGKVVCSNLGMRSVVVRGSYRVPTDDFILNDVRCKGTELSLTECWYSTRDNCDADDGIFVRCVQVRRIRKADRISVVNGDVRLNGTRALMVGETILSGAVETFYNGVWGYVCDDDYDTAGNYFGKVVCNNLDMRFVEGRDGYRVPTDDFILDDVRCKGTELSLTECWYSTRDNCDATEGIFVRCDQVRTTDGDVRLNGTRDLMVGETTLSGAVETFYNGTWGYVCDDTYSDNFGKVVCNNLMGMRFVEGRGSYRVPTDDFIMDDVRCSGTELYLTECLYDTDENCSAGEGIFVRCAL